MLVSNLPFLDCGQTRIQHGSEVTGEYEINVDQLCHPSKSRKVSTGQRGQSAGSVSGGSQRMFRSGNGQDRRCVKIDPEVVVVCQDQDLTPRLFPNAVILPPSPSQPPP